MNHLKQNNNKKVNLAVDFSQCGISVLSYIKVSATFMHSFTLWCVDIPPTLFPVCLGLVSARHNVSASESVGNKNLLNLQI